MGQVIGQMPDTWEGLLEEKDRIIHWSGEVLSKVTDNINQEESFQLDYDNDKIERKIEAWVQSNQAQVQEIINKYGTATEELKNKLRVEVTKLREDFRKKMRNDYQSAYKDIKKFTKKFDELGKQQSKIHAAIQDLADNCANDVKKFQKKFGQLRVKTFNHLKAGENMVAEYEKLKSEFKKRVYDIDHKNAEEYERRLSKLLKDFEKAALK